MKLTYDTLHEGISATLVEAGTAPDDAEDITTQIIDSADMAVRAAVTTIDLNLPELGRNEVPARHLALQVMVARLNVLVDEIENYLTSDGAQTRVVPFGVPTNG